MPGVDSSVRRFGVPALVVALTGYAVVALGDPGVEISHAAAIVAGGGVGVAGFVVATLLVKERDGWPWRRLLVGAVVLVALTALVLVMPSDEGEIKTPEGGNGTGPTLGDGSERPPLPPSDGGVPAWMIVVLAAVAVVVAALVWRRIARRRRPPLGARTPGELATLGAASARPRYSTLRSPPPGITRDGRGR